MRLRIAHETVISYDPAVMHAIFVVRQTPATGSAQFVRDWRIDVSDDCWMDSVTDAFGNTLATFSLKGPLETVRIVAAGEVEVDDTNGVTADGGDRLPAGFYLRDTALTEPNAGIHALAAGIAAASDGALGRLHGLSGWIEEKIALAPRTDGVPDAAGVLAGTKGNAAGGAHLFVAVARCMGIPARVVSGYLYEPSAPKATGLHMWAEGFVPRLGWVGFDPVFGRCPTDCYVRLAAGTDALGVAPVREACDSSGIRILETKATVTEPGRRALASAAAQRPKAADGMLQVQG